MRHFSVAAINELLAEGSVAQYTYEKTFEHAAQDPFIVIHTSGSTGLPKPIIIRHGGLATIDAHRLLSPLNGHKPMVKVMEGPLRAFTSLPPFHVSSSLFSEPSIYIYAIFRIEPGDSGGRYITGSCCRIVL